MPVKANLDLFVDSRSLTASGKNVIHDVVALRVAR